MLTMGRKKAVDDSAESEGGRSYFPWNDDLDELLVKSIIVIADNKKVDAKGKFANGAHTLLERLMLHERPNCRVKASPNIVSRCKTLKAKVLAVQELRGLSGAGWDDVKKAVDIDDTSYAEKLLTVPNSIEFLFHVMMGWRRCLERFVQLAKMQLGMKSWINQFLSLRFQGICNWNGGVQDLVITIQVPPIRMRKYIRMVM
ncbi:hypothetical protein LINPERHAP1_LOCUS4598 [Linum perenne]